MKIQQWRVKQKRKDLWLDADPVIYIAIQSAQDRRFWKEETDTDTHKYQQEQVKRQGGGGRREGSYHSVMDSNWLDITVNG